MNSILKLEKAYLIVIFVLPLASICLSLGLIAHIPWLMALGSAVIDNLPLLFAVAIAHGFSKDHNGYSAISGLVGYLAFHNVLNSLYGDVDMGMFGGICVGMMTALVYNQTYNKRFDGVLEILSKRRAIPLINFAIQPLIALVVGGIWRYLDQLIKALANQIGEMGALGVFLYGFLNRMLLPFGLHFNLNHYIYYELGSYEGIQGDLNRFMAGDPTAGLYTAGFYIVFMFGLPGAMLAFYKATPKKNRRQLYGVYLLSTLGCVLTGISEPVEIIFMFLLPLLYVLHAVLTGLALVSAYLLEVHLGFNFSAGLIDYLGYFERGKQAVLLLPLGVLFMGLYYGCTRFMSQYFSLPVPINQFYSERLQLENAARFVDELIIAFGGQSNIRYVELKYTRFEIAIKASLRVNELMLESFEQVQLIKVDENTYQLITGNRGRYLSVAFSEKLLEKVI